MAAWAIRWILMHEGVTCAISGAERAALVEENALAADLPPLPEETMAKVAEIYARRARPPVHHLW